MIFLRTFACKYAAFFLLNALIAHAAPAAEADEQPRTQMIEIEPGLYFHRDRLVSNSTVLVTDEGVLVVDSRMHPKDGRGLIAEIRKLTDQPIKWVINGQYHGDHYLGNAAFKTEGATIVAQRHTARVMREKFQHELKRRTPAWEKYGYNPAEVTFVGPDAIFDDRMTIQLGDQTIDLIYIGDGQNQGDTVVVFRDKRATYSSGALTRQSWSNTSYTLSVNGWIDTLGKIRELDVDTYLPGHGSVITDRADIDEEITFLKRLQVDVRAAIAAGKSADEIAQTLTYEEFSHYRNYKNRARNLRAIYQLETTGTPAYFSH